MNCSPNGSVVRILFTYFDSSASSHAHYPVTADFLQ